MKKGLSNNSIAIRAVDLSADTPFRVKESVGINLFIACILAVVAGFAAAYDKGNGLIFVTFAAAAIAVIFILKALKNKTVILVDINGIYAGNKLITDWYHFAAARYKQEHSRATSITDDFVLIVEYSKDGIPGFFKSTIGLGATQDRSEEEVLEAVNFFYGLFLKEHYPHLQS